MQERDKTTWLGGYRERNTISSGQWRTTCTHWHEVGRALQSGGWAGYQPPQHSVQGKDYMITLIDSVYNYT